MSKSTRRFFVLSLMVENTKNPMVQLYQNDDISALFSIISQVRKGILPRLLEEILLTRIMVKQEMKKLAPSQKVLQRVRLFHTTAVFNLLVNHCCW